MVNRKKFDRSLYNPFVQASGGKGPCHVHHPEQSTFCSNANKHSGVRFQDYTRNQHKHGDCANIHQMRNSYLLNHHTGELPKDFRHACSMCPGDFSHTSCKYCLNEVEENVVPEPPPPENVEEAEHSCCVHEPPHHFNYDCYCCTEPSSCLINDEVPFTFVNNGSRFSKNFYNQISRENYCEFCLKNGETAIIYKSHQLKTPSGSISCPLFKEYVCCSCGIGSHAGTSPNYEKLNFGQCSSNDYMDVPLYRPNYHSDLHQHGYNSRNNLSCLYCLPSNHSGGTRVLNGVGKNYTSEGYAKHPFERTSAAPFLPRFSNGRFSKYEYYDLMNLR